MKNKTNKAFALPSVEDVLKDVHAAPFYTVKYSGPVRLTNTQNHAINVS